MPDTRASGVVVGPVEPVLNNTHAVLTTLSRGHTIVTILSQLKLVFVAAIPDAGLSLGWNSVGPLRERANPGGPTLEGQPMGSQKYSPTAISSRRTSRFAAWVNWNGHWPKSTQTPCYEISTYVL